MSKVQDTSPVTSASSHARRKTHGKRSTVVMGCPRGFERLTRFFASQSALARALGVHRDTIRAWEQGLPTRLRIASVARVEGVSAVAEEVARYLPDDEMVGEWLLSPQLALGGSSAAALIRRDPRACHHVLRLVERDAQPVSAGDAAELVESGVSDTDLDPPALRAAAPDPDADPAFSAGLGY